MGLPYIVSFKSLRKLLINTEVFLGRKLLIDARQTETSFAPFSSNTKRNHSCLKRVRETPCIPNRLSKSSISKPVTYHISCLFSRRCSSLQHDPFLARKENPNRLDGEPAQHNQKILALMEKLEKLLEKERTRIHNRQQSLLKEKIRNEERDDLFEKAQLIVANQSNIPAYSQLEKPIAVVKVVGFTSDGLVDLKLNTGAYGNAIEESQDLFKQCKKMKRGLIRIEEGLLKNKKKLSQVMDILEELKSKRADFDSENSFDVDEFEQFETRLRKMLGLKERSPTEKASTKRVTSKIYKLFRSPDERAILVGRSAAQNDKLTFQVGSPNDLWLHAKHCSGSHVIIKIRDKNNADVSRETLQMAANLAALHSKNKHMSEVPVLVAMRKHISKPKGTKAGAVYVRKEMMTLTGIPSVASELEHL